MNPETVFQIQLLLKKNPSKPVLCVVKGSSRFVSDLSGLDVSDSISLLFMNSAYQKIENPVNIAKFDAVVWFDGINLGCWTEETLANLDALDFPNLKLKIGHLCQLVESKRVRLVAMEEEFVRLLATIRSTYSIPGAQPNDVEPYSDKMKMKVLATKCNIRTAKYGFIKPMDLLMDNNSLERLEKIVPYPMFVKPTQGCGAIGTDKIENRAALYAWAEKMVAEESTFLVEEYIVGHEVHLLGLYQRGNIQFFPCNILRKPLSIYEFIKAGKPMAVYNARDQAEKEGLFQFGREVVKAFPPVEGSLMYIQCFETSNGYVLNEIAIRVPYITGSTVFYENSGINPEVIQIMGQIKVINFSDFVKPMSYFGLLSYPNREIKNCKLVEVPKNGLTSRLEARWKVKSGQDLAKATNVCDLIVRVCLWNDDYDQLLHDMTFLRENYDPLIVKTNKFIY